MLPKDLQELLSAGIFNLSNNHCPKCNELKSISINSAQNIIQKCKCQSDKPEGIKDFFQKKSFPELHDAKCVYHNNNPGIYSCSTCNDYFCFECSLSHDLDNHDNTFKLEKNYRKTCPNCKEAYTQYCTGCKNHICTRCSPCQNDGHNIINLDNLINQLERNFKSFIIKRNEFFKKAQKEKNELINELESLKKKINIRYDIMLEKNVPIFRLIETLFYNCFLYQNDYILLRNLFDNYKDFTYNITGFDNINNSIKSISDLLGVYFNSLNVSFKNEPIENIITLDDIKESISSLIVTSGNSEGINKSIVYCSTFKDNTLQRYTFENDKIKENTNDIFELKPKGNDKLKINNILIVNDDILLSSLDYSIHKCSKNNGKITNIFKGHKDIINKLVEISDTSFASCSNDYTIKIWNINNPKNTQGLSEHFDWVNSMIYINESETLVSGTGGDENKIIFWKGKDDYYYKNKNFKKQTEYSNISCNHKNALFHYNNTLFVGSFNQIFTIKIGEDEATSIITNSPDLGNIFNFIEAKENIICGTERGKFLIISLKNEAMTWQVLLDSAHDNFINSINSLDENHFISSDEKGIIKFWKLSLE